MTVLEESGPAFEEPGPPDEVTSVVPSCGDGCGLGDVDPCAVHAVVLSTASVPATIRVLRIRWPIMVTPLPRCCLAVRRTFRTAPRWSL